jgi:FkbM family methyltransferase
VYLASGYGRAKSQPYFDQLYQYALGGMNIGGGAHVSASGESRVIRSALDTSIAYSDQPVVFDVGANQGLYALAVLEMLGARGMIHCFEPSKETFKQLQNQVSARQNVVLHNFGLSDRAEKLTLYSNVAGSGLASVYHRRLDHFNVNMDLQEQITLQVLDDFCLENGIHRIDLLKLDVEGHELAVLRGAQKMIESHAIRLIQFEFGGCNIDSRTFFQDFFYLLNPFYTLHRIVKDGWVAIPEYQERQELFITTNFLAISRRIS